MEKQETPISCNQWALAASSSTTPRPARINPALRRTFCSPYLSPLPLSLFLRFSPLLSYTFLFAATPFVTGICFNFSTPLCPSSFLLPKHPFRPRIPTASSRIEILQKEHIKRRMSKSVRCANYLPDDCRFLSTLFVFPFRAPFSFSQYYCPRALLPSNYRKAAPHRCVSWRCSNVVASLCSNRPINA